MWQNVYQSTACCINQNKEVIIKHHARIITYPDIQKKKLISLLTDDFYMPQEGYYRHL